MTTEPTEYDDDDDDQSPEGEKFRDMRRKANKADRLEKELAEARAGERELAFYRAGLKPEDLNTPVGQMFARAYDGELTAEAVTAAWSALGAVVAPEPDDDVIPAEEQAASRERQTLASGGQGDTGVAPPKPVRGEEGAAVQAGRQALAGGASREDAMGSTFRALTDAAAQGNREVILPFGGQTE